MWSHGREGVSLSTANNVDMGVYPFTATGTVDVQDVSLSTTSSVDMQGVSLSLACCMDMQGVFICTIISVYCRAYSL